MNYHIIIQDKFFASYIEDVYRIHQEDNNVFWVRGNKGENHFFQPQNPVEYVPETIDALCEKLRTLKPNDKLVVAWYDILVGSAILKSGIQNPLYVYPLGADFYGEPEWYHERWLLDPMTKCKMYKTYLMPYFFPLNKPWRWYRIFNLFAFRHRMKQQYHQKLDTIKRIDFLVMPEHSLFSLQLFKKLYPSLRAQHVYGTFDQNFEIASICKQNKVPKRGERIKVLLGNSADPLGNHIDAINCIKKQVRAPFELYCFLSYGDAKSREWTIEYGRKKIGEHFHPIVEFMGRKDFVEFVNSMDVVIMYHNRSQAAGTTMTALTLGKPVFLKPQTSLMALMRALDIQSVLDVTSISKIDMYDVIDNARKNRKETTVKIHHEYSDEVRLNYLKKILA